MRRTSTVRILDGVDNEGSTKGALVSPAQQQQSVPLSRLGSFLGSGGSSVQGTHEPAMPAQVALPTRAATSFSTSPTPKSSSRPKPSVQQLVQVGDVSALVSLVAQRHAVAKDRESLMALSDIAERMMTERAMMPRALANIHLSNQREVLMEELASHRLRVQQLHHFVRIAEDEHERLLCANDSLLAIVKRKDDLHGQTTKQFHIAGAMDAEANEALLKLEGRRRTLLGFAGAMRRDVDRVAGRNVFVEREGKRKKPSDNQARGDIACPTQPIIPCKQRATHSGLGWTTSVDDGRVTKSAGQRNETPIHRIPASNDPMDRRAKPPGKDGPAAVAEEVERQIFDLRMSGHELLSRLEAEIARALDVADPVPGGVDGAMTASRRLRKVLHESTEGRGSLWLFSPCTKPTCQAARESLMALLREQGNLSVAL